MLWYYAKDVSEGFYRSVDECLRDIVARYPETYNSVCEITYSFFDLEVVKIEGDGDVWVFTIVGDTVIYKVWLDARVPDWGISKKVTVHYDRDKGRDDKVYEILPEDISGFLRSHNCSDILEVWEDGDKWFVKFESGADTQTLCREASEIYLLR